MADFSSDLRTQGLDLFKRLSRGQRLLIGVTAAAVLIGMILVVTLANQPGYTTLFTNLSAQDASHIVEKLKERKISYKIEDGGKTILVPKDQVYDLRLSMAGEGLPMNSTIGYEIFDRTNFGVSDYVQKINYRRALEGELGRTILQLDEVEAARVHIVIPDKALFKEDEKPTTASVVLKLKSTRGVKKENIQGIQHLVSSSVEGLEIDNVKVLDSRGMLLSEHAPGNTLAGLSSTQYELQQKVETYLARKAEGILSGVLGSGNAVVQVNAELDFRQVESTLEEYDPEKTVVRSEQMTEQRSMIADTLPPSTSTTSTTNYEVNKKVEHIIDQVGAVKRLSVAAIINSVPKVVEVNGEKKTEYVPRSANEMNQLGDIVKKAIGFSTERNDQVSVVNLPFGTESTEMQMVERSPLEQYSDQITNVLIVLAMIAAMLILRSLVGRMRTKQEGTSIEHLGEPAMAALAAASGVVAGLDTTSPVALLDEAVSNDMQMKAERRKMIADYVKRKPEEASRLLKVWMVE